MITPGISLDIPTANRHLSKKILETFGLDPNGGQSFYDDSEDFVGGEQVDLDGEAIAPAWRPDIGAFRRHHTVTLNYPELKVLENPSEEFILNKPKNAEERYAPHPLILDEKVMRHAARDKITDKSFYTSYRCDQPNPDPSVRDFTMLDIFVDVEEASQCHGTTDLSAVIFRYRHQPELGHYIRIRRSTSFIWGDIVDHNVRDYTFTLWDFVSFKKAGNTTMQPPWYRDLIHLMDVESDRAARCIAHKLEHYANTRQDSDNVYPKFINSFGLGSRWTQDFDKHLSPFLVRHKTPANEIAPLCMHCGTKCDRYTTLPCSKNHIIHNSCLMKLWRTVPPENLSCHICKSPFFTDPKEIRSLKFSINPTDNLFYPDSRYTEWENFEKSCSDLDSHSASTNRNSITITRTFLTGLWRKFVTAGIEPGIPENLRFDIPDEYLLLESIVDGQFMHLEGLTTEIWAIDRWIKKMVQRRFTKEFLNWNLELGLTIEDRQKYASTTEKHDLFRKVLKPGWYGQFFKTLNRVLRFLSERCCLCEEGAAAGQVYHWHGGREYYSRREVDRELMGNVTEARRAVYDWQGSEEGREMMRQFLEEVGKGDEERNKREDEETLRRQR